MSQARAKNFLIFLRVSNRSQLCLRLRLKTFSRSRTPLPTCSLWYLPLPFYVFASAGFTYLPVVFEYLPLAVCTRVAVFRGRQLEGVDGSVGRVMAVWGGHSRNPSPIISGDRLSAVYRVPKHISTPRKMVKEMWWGAERRCGAGGRGLIINFGSLPSILVASRSAPAHHRAHHRAHHAQNVIRGQE